MTLLRGGMPVAGCGPCFDSRPREKVWSDSWITGNLLSNLEVILYCIVTPDPEGVGSQALSMSSLIFIETPCQHRRNGRKSP